MSDAEVTALAAVLVAVIEALVTLTQSITKLTVVVERIE